MRARFSTLVLPLCAQRRRTGSTPASTWGLDGVGRVSYSTDVVEFKQIGMPCKAGWAFYRGDRIGIFTTGPAGYVNIHSFSYAVQ